MPGKARKTLATVWDQLSGILGVLFVCFVWMGIEAVWNSDYVTEHPVQVRLAGIGVLILIDILFFGAIGYLRRDQMDMAVLPTLMLGVLGVWFFWQFTL